jgi:hypothetical protein
MKLPATLILLAFSYLPIFAQTDASSLAGARRRGVWQAMTPCGGAAVPGTGRKRVVPRHETGFLLASLEEFAGRRDTADMSHCFLGTFQALVFNRFQGALNG